LKNHGALQNSSAELYHLILAVFHNCRGWETRYNDSRCALENLACLL